MDLLVLLALRGRINRALVQLARARFVLIIPSLMLVLLHARATSDFLVHLARMSTNAHCRCTPVMQMGLALTQLDPFFAHAMRGSQD